MIIVIFSGKKCSHFGISMHECRAIERLVNMWHRFVALKNIALRKFDLLAILISHLNIEQLSIFIFNRNFPLRIVFIDQCQADAFQLSA